ncbi:hypothetical protein HNR42_002708 [Deinobacterium chartae]|uniref:Uncharacterized protein n=1 Tax=Deinobacterium chartae TaxID=521158 RepID=A0A841I4D2_9DEIO|nr:hypothetical protein [Deinobacterium chartae]MBB6099270.1 hypothetical protein [Deinobacterium chartae]
MTAALEAWLASYQERRSVRGLAWSGSQGTDLSWRGAVRVLLSFERRLEAETREALHFPEGEVLLRRFPYEHLEEWRDWQLALREAPVALLADMRPLYDPTGNLARIRRMLDALEGPDLADYRTDLLRRAHEDLSAWRKRLSQPARHPAEQIRGLLRARELATGLLYPALLSLSGSFLESDLRYPERLRAAALLRFPRAVYLLDPLYGFGGEAEARHILQATRGLGLGDAERRAREALEAGFFDGAVFFLRQESARGRDADLRDWNHLPHARRERLSLLWGLERCPLGPAALQLAETLLAEVEKAAAQRE